MKTIIITGGGSRVGKTTLAHRLGSMLPAAEVVKIGTHPPKSHKPPLYFPIGTHYDDLCNSITNIDRCEFLIIESGAILDDPALAPDLVIFLPAKENKPGSERRAARADLIRHQHVSASAVEKLRKRLGLDGLKMTHLLETVEIPVVNP